MPSRVTPSPRTGWRWLQCGRTDLGCRTSSCSPEAEGLRPELCRRSGVFAAQLATAGQCPAGTCGHEAVAYSRRAGVPQPRGATLMAERHSTESCTGTNGSGGCRRDTESASPDRCVLPVVLRAGRAGAWPLLRDAASPRRALTCSLSVWPPAAAGAVSGCSLCCPWWGPVQRAGAWGGRQHGHRTASSHCLVPGHGGWGKMLARLTAFLIKKLLHNLQSASAI